MEKELRADRIGRRMLEMQARVSKTRQEGLYYFNQPISELQGGAQVTVSGKTMLMLASYSYLGLIGHPRINAAAQAAIERYGTGTHGVRSLAGSLPVHEALEETIAAFKGTEAAITYSSGYVTNLTVIATLVQRGDYVFSDKLNHASIVDGCRMSGAEFQRFSHLDLGELEARLQRAPEDAGRLVVCDAVFSMDGDIMELPRLAALCRKYSAWLMMDEAHSVGVLGKTGRGIEEHFGMEGAIDIKMGTLSKAIPSVGGYVAGAQVLIDYLRHASRGYIFSAALPPAQAAAADAAFKVILDEPWRAARLQANSRQFIGGLKAAGFNTLQTETAIVPVICGTDETAYRMTRECQARGLFVLPVISPAVPEGTARLRTTVTAAHEPGEVARAIDGLSEVGRALGVLG